MNRREKLIALQADRQKAIDAADALLAIAKDESLTPEQTAESQALMASIDEITAQIDTLAKEQADIDAQAAKLAELRNRPDNPAVRNMLNNYGGSTVPFMPHTGGQNVTQFGLPRNIRRQSVVNFRGEFDGMDAQVRAYRFGMYAMHLLSQQLPHRFQFPHATKFCLDQGILNAAHQSGGSDTTGSHLFVPEEFSTDLILLREQFGVARTAFARETMTGDTKRVPRQLTGLTAYFRGQSEAGTESNATFDDVTLVARDLMAIARMTAELNADSAISFGDKLVGEIAYAFANKEDECGFNGTGTSTYGGMTGVRTQLDTLTAGTAPGAILADGNAYSEITLANLESVVGALPQYADRPGTAWFCHKTFYATVMMRLALASGGVTSTEIINGVRTAMFLGYPVRVSQVFPSTAANSQIPCVFGDLSLAGFFGDRQQESISFSDQATVGGESMWERNQIGVRGTERFDIVVANFGSASTAGPVISLELAAS